MKIARDLLTMVKIFSIMGRLKPIASTIYQPIRTTGGITIKPAIHQTEIPGVPLLRRGKVRDVYDLGDKLLVVATDRISAFDCILPNAIPSKGVVLTQMSLFWFDFVSDLVVNHLIS